MGILDFSLFNMTLMISNVTRCQMFPAGDCSIFSKTPPKYLPVYCWKRPHRGQREMAGFKDGLKRRASAIMAASRLRLAKECAMEVFTPGNETATANSI